MLGVNKFVQTIIKHLINIVNDDGKPSIKKLQNTNH